MKTGFGIMGGGVFFMRLVVGPTGGGVISLSDVVYVFFSVAFCYGILLYLFVVVCNLYEYAL